MDTWQQYEAKKADILKQYSELRKTGDIRLGKNTSNLFRSRTNTKHKLNVRNLNQVITIDEKTLTAQLEGMTTFETYVRETLRLGLVPTVVPELRSITVGGAVSGVAIESSSFKYGLVHETVLELEILLSDGSVVVATRTNKYKDLFYGLPNSYGTLGYVLRLKMQLVRAKNYVKIEHKKYTDNKQYFRDLKSTCLVKKHDYVDGTVFSKNEMYLTTGTFTDEAPHVSKYTFRHIYYKSIQKKTVDYVTVHDYIWRWDTDWFWCSKNVGAQNWLLRPFYGLIGLRSTTYWKIMALNRKYKLAEKVNKIRGKKSTDESVIQDVQTAAEQAPAFFDFFFDEIKITPLWICPTVRCNSTDEFPLYELKPRTVYVNFGFWDVVPRNPKDAGHHNKRIEQVIAKLHGRKSLYSDAYYAENDFWKHYNKPTYRKLKQKYDPKYLLKDLYQKTVLKK